MKLIKAKKSMRRKMKKRNLVTNLMENLFLNNIKTLPLILKLKNLFYLKKSKNVH